MGLVQTDGEEDEREKWQSRWLVSRISCKFLGRCLHNWRMKDFWEKCGASQKHVGHDCTEQWRGRGKRGGERGERMG